MAWYTTSVDAIAAGGKVETQKREGADTMGILTTTDLRRLHPRTQTVMTQYTLSGLTMRQLTRTLTAQATALGNQATKQPIGAGGYSVSTQR